MINHLRNIYSLIGNLSVFFLTRFCVANLFALFFVLPCYVSLRSEFRVVMSITISAYNLCRGGSREGRTQRAPPLKLEKILFFWRKIVIFHTKYPNNFRASLHSAQFFKLRPS